MNTRNQTDPASVSDTQPASVEVGKSLILRVQDFTERMERYGWTLTRNRDGLEDRYGYLHENGLFKEISFAQIVDYCNRNLSMSEVAACSDILPLGDELYGDYPPPANQPADDLRLESQNVEASGGALPCTQVPLNGLTSKRSSSLPSVWGVSRNGFYYPRAVLLLLAVLCPVLGVLIMRTTIYSIFFRNRCRKPDATNR